MNISSTLINLIGLPTVSFNISGFSTIVVFCRFFLFKLFFGYSSLRLFLGCVEFYKIVILIGITIIGFFRLEKSSWPWSVVSFFWVFLNPFFIEFIIQLDCYLIKNIQFVMSSSVPHKLIFDVFLQTSLEYIHQCNIILFGTVGSLLEFRDILCCRFRLLYFLNSLFRDSVFVGDTEDSANLLLENLPVLKKYFDIGVAGVFQIY